jgi:hypothetical protein
MKVFWDIAPRSLVEVDRRFRGAYCLYPILMAMMEVVSTSETSASFYETTRRHIPEDRRLHTRRRENLNINCISFCGKHTDRNNCCSNFHVVSSLLDDCFEISHICSFAD